jgi:hypothetical protein
MDRAAMVLLLAGAVPLVAVGAFALAHTVAGVLDPCATWGTSWSNEQSGGGSSPGPPGCEAGTSWTTEAPAHALARGALLPAGALAGLALGVVGLRRRASVPMGLAIGVLLVFGFPLTLGSTVFVAAVPALLAALAARHAGMARRGGVLGAGVFAAGLALFFLASVAVSYDDLAAQPVAGVVALLFATEVGAVAAACLVAPRAPREGAPASTVS